MNNFYDLKLKKKIKLKIDLQTKKKILNNEIRILYKKEVKDYKNYLNKIRKDLSNDDKNLPLYDYSNNKFFLINKEDVFYFIKKYYFRPLNKELESLIDNDIIKSFDYDILDKLLVKFIYYNTKDIGEDITLFKNPAYIKYLDNKPFLKKSSIINTGLNLGKIKIKDLPLDRTNLLNIYNKVKTYFFTKKEIENHIKHIISNNTISIINFYTMYGSFFMNRYLRFPNDMLYDKKLEEMIQKLNDTITTSPKLKNKKVIFRFLHDDSFLENLMIGDIYLNNSFMSCTRKPNISTLDNEFGLILLKIYLPKNEKGCCLSIEANSVFKNEKEVILAPFTKLKLVSVNNNVDFYIFDKFTNRNIKKKYEFEYIGKNEFKFKIHDKGIINEINFLNDEINGDSLSEKIDDFWKNYINKSKRFILKYENKQKIFYCNYYDSTSFYKKFFYYNIENGLFIYSFDENNTIDTFFEIGSKLIVNFPSRYFNINTNENIKLFSSLIAYGFKISKIKLFPKYYPISNITNTNSIYSKIISFNKIIYDLVFNNTSKLLVNNQVKINAYLNSIVKKSNLNYNIQKYIDNKKNYIKIIKEIIIDNPENIKYINESFPNYIKFIYYNFDPFGYLIFKKKIFNLPVIIDNLEKKKEDIRSPEYEDIQNNEFRKIN